jgi:glycine oxidase
MPPNCDCLIIGGGVIGLSLAYELARHDLRVRVIDKGPAGKEASWAGAGMLPPASRATAVHPLAQLQALSHELHPRWAEWLGQESGLDTGFRRCGAIYLARSLGEAASLSGYIDELREQQVQVERLSVSRLAELEPCLAELGGRGQIKAACLLPDEAQLRNPRHLKALQIACARRGVELLSNIEALGFRCDGRRLRELRTSQGPQVADRFCLTSGAWTQGLLRQLQITTGILPIRGQMILLRCQRPPLTHILNEGPRYVVPRDDGLVLVGSTEEEVGFDKSNTEQAVEELRRLAGQLVPPLRDLPLEACWSGLRPGSYDGFPYLGAAPGLENVFVAAGHFRAGLSLSPATAVVVGRLIRGEDPGIDLAPFHVGRG